MPAIAAITIADGQVAPVNKTFNPDNIKNEVATWYDRSGGIAVGYPVITVSVRPPSRNSTSRVNKVTVKIVVPVLEQVAPSTVWTKAYETTFTGEFLMHERSTLQDRKNLLAFAKNFLAHAVAQAAVHDLEPSY